MNTEQATECVRCCGDDCHCGCAYDGRCHGHPDTPIPTPDVAPWSAVVVDSTTNRLVTDPGRVTLAVSRCGWSVQGRDGAGGWLVVVDDDTDADLAAGGEILKMVGSTLIAITGIDEDGEGGWSTRGDR